MATYKEFLRSLSVMPSAEEIDAAGNYAHEKASDYAKSFDEEAVVTVEEGETYVVWDIEEDEITWNVQVVFDEAFSEKIYEMGYRN